MSEGTEPTAAPPAAPPPPPGAGAATPPPRKPMPGWQRIVYSITGVIFLVIGAARLFNAMSPSLPDCDDHNLQDQMKTTISASQHSQVTGLTNTRTVSRTDTAGRCVAHIAFANGVQGEMHYNVSLNGRTTSWRTEDIPTPTPSCDAPAIQTQVRELIQGGNGVTVASLSNVRTLLQQPDQNGCEVDVAFTDARTADVRYTITMHSDGRYQIDTAPFMFHGGEQAAGQSGSGQVPQPGVGPPAQPPAGDGQQPAPGADQGPGDQGGGDQQPAQGGGKP